MKPDVKKIIADIKATKGNRKFCNGLAGTLQDDNYASSICKYVKTVTPERIDLLIEYAEKLEAEVTDMAVQLANAESKCRELAAENAGLKQRTQQLIDIISNTDNDYCMCGSAMKDHVHSGCGYPTGMFDYYYNQWLESDNKTPATDAFLAEVKTEARNELAAENAGLKAAAKETLAHWAAAEPSEMEQMMDKCMPNLRIAYCETQATDAFLAEVRAQGVDEFLRGSQLPYQIATVLADYDNVDDATLQTVIWSGQPPEPDGDVWHLEYVSRGNAIVRAVLKEIRKGVQS